MPTPTNQLLTPMEVADGVLAQIVAPIDGTVWSQSGFAARRVWMPLHTESDLATLQVDVIAMYRGRGLHKGDNQSPAHGRVARNQVRTSHWVQILMQKLVGTDPDLYEPAIDALAAFQCQVDDYWHVSGRLITNLASRSTALSIVSMYSEIEALYSPKDLDAKGLWASRLYLNLTLVEQW